MNREEADTLIRAFYVASKDIYIAHRSREARDGPEGHACIDKYNHLREQLVVALCADPNAEAIDKLRQAALGVLGLIMLFPIDELAPLERREFWERQIAAAASDLKEGLNATEEG